MTQTVRVKRFVQPGGSAAGAESIYAGCVHPVEDLLIDDRQDSRTERLIVNAKNLPILHTPMLFSAVSFKPIHASKDFLSLFQAQCKKIVIFLTYLGIYLYSR